MHAPRIDWNAPWFAAVAEAGRAVERAAAARTALAAVEPAADARTAPDAVELVDDARAALTAAATRLGVCNARGLAIRFGPPDAAGADAYEAHIDRTGEVPTRANRHDFFNGLAWLAFPRTKARLNALQAAAIARCGIGDRRGRLRDAATLIDENALLLVTDRRDLVDALAAHDWHRLFVVERAAWQSGIRAVVFGHALMEKLTAPYRGVTAHALVLHLPAAASLVQIDGAAAAALDEDLAPGRLLPLPVLGIPGWADNDDVAYYNDPVVFRPARVERASAHRSARSSA